MENIGKEIFKTIKKLFPINRSLTGEGNRKTLRVLNSVCKNLKILEFKSGTKAYDWRVPEEWNAKNAYIKCDNKKIIDFKNNNLHLMSYSEPVNKILSFEDMDKHLYSLKKKPNVIPYVTSYYKKRWGFCLKHKTRMRLNKNKL